MIGGRSMLPASLDLLLPVHAEVHGVHRRLGLGDVRIVDPLVVQLVVGDGVVLEAGRHPVPLGMDVRPDVVHRQVEADVAVEVAVVRVAGVAVLGAPHLLGRLGVAAESGHAARAVERRVDAVDRTAIGVEDAVRVDEEVADARFAQQLVDAGDIAALAQPHAPRAAAEVLLVEVGGDVNLGAHAPPSCGPCSGKKACVAVTVMTSRHARVLQVAEAPDQVALVAAPGVAQRLEAVWYICASRW